MPSTHLRNSRSRAKKSGTSGEQFHKTEKKSFPTRALMMMRMKMMKMLFMMEPGQGEE
ncbi:hypothetical protein CASFOL_040265 [Castilleja foliolosa]|uniref:Uncharacterized protein n=1 Tax=Castilleja foliolosa TaxID=1961234 RepID=A0ABD3BFZ6_9LAMI